jgi:integrase
VRAKCKGYSSTVTVTLGKTSLLTLPKARAEAKEVLYKLSKGINPNIERREGVKAEAEEIKQYKARGITLRKAMVDYLGIGGRKERTKLDIEQTLNRRVHDWMDIPLRDISREMVMARFTKIMADVKKKRDLIRAKRKSKGLDAHVYASEDGRGEAQRCMRYLTSIINSVMDDVVAGKKLLESNPCKILSDKKARKALAPRETYLNHHQRETVFELLSHIRHPEYAGSVKPDASDLVTLLLITGIRFEEALGLRWQDVDFNAHFFTCRDTKNGRNHMVPLTKTTTKLFKRRRAEVGSSPWVFPSPLNPKKHASASRWVESIVKETGIKFNHHDLRRTFGTVAYDMGVDVLAISKAMNHKKKGVTAGYIQAAAEGLTKTFEAVEEAILHYEESTK